MTTTTLDAARETLALDIYPVPIRERSKAPTLANWTNVRIGIDDLDQHFSNGNGLGWLLGIAPRVIADVDLDCTEALAVRPYIAGPSTERIFGRASKPTSHFLYEAAEEFDSLRFEDPVRKKQDPHAKAMLVELRGRGGQTVVPPSVHESGEPIRWERAGKFGKATVADLRTWVAKLAATSLLIRYWPRGHETRHALAGMLARAGWPQEQTAELVCAILRIAQPDNREVRTDVRTCYARLERDEEVYGRPKLVQLLGEHGKLVVQNVSQWLGLKQDDGFPATDGENADKFAEQHAADLRFCTEQRIWYAWDGQRWQRDAIGEVMRRARETAGAIFADARATPEDTKEGEEKKKKRLKWACRADSRNGLEGMVSLARWHESIEVRSFAKSFDTDPLLLNCENGIVDLRTGELGPHRREAMLTKMSLIAYNAEARYTNFVSFLAETFADQSLVGYIQQLAGYCLTGLTNEQALFVWTGPTQTGKSTFVKILRGLLGDYATSLPEGTLLAKKFDDDDHAAADLPGIRLATAVETAAGKRLNEARIKHLTGEDFVKARHLYENLFEFRPQAKLIIATNHKPIIRDTDDSVWRRVKVIEFVRQVPADKIVRDMDKKLLEAEGPGILAWAVEGCRKWLAEGVLKEPERIIEAGRSYRRNMDRVQSFVTENCDTGSDASITKAALYTEYARQATEGNEGRPISKTAFGKQMINLGYKEGAGRAHVQWVGLRLKPEVQAAIDERAERETALATALGALQPPEAPRNAFCRR